MLMVSNLDNMIFTPFFWPFQQKDKQLQNSTPKKKLSPPGVKGANSRQVLTDLAQTDKLVPDLRLEAKLSAEVSALGLSNK